MKTSRSAVGPFLERPFFTLEEIEQICNDELEKAKLLPVAPCPIRIERFLEKRFSIQVRYDDLPDGVLGLTEFGKHGVQAIVIAKALDDEGTQAADRRIRTTMGHEGGHGLLHAHLFALGQEAYPLFGDNTGSKPRVLCRTNGIPYKTTDTSKHYDGRWWEFQANQAVGALLLPKRLVEVSLTQLLVSNGALGLRSIERSRKEEAAQLLAETFEVNPVVARIRLAALYPDTGTQLTL